MTRIHTRLAFVAVALLPFVAAQGGDAPAPYDCERITVDGHAYNISAFKPTTFTIKGEPKDEHPSKIRVDYQLNPCQAIVIPEGEAKSHCKANAWVCQDTKLVPEEGDPKTLFLRTIAGSAPANDGQPARDVAPSVARADKIEDVKELPWNLTLKGGNINGQDQSAVITFICDMAVTDEKAGPTLIKYENGVVYFSWKSSVACPREIQLPTSEGMSGFGVFMTVLIVFGLIYLVLGAIYNRQVYGARGLDMLPNIGFWKDFPSLVVDVVRHVWDSVTGRHSSRGGAYVSV
ncbi:autophagy-related protein 27 [Gamsiella multidivaricata]|uniref:autophagy-related protein 27 n=1 Tax=Gamsiella multidivaricata TaxID=101098 RepID=UPI00221F2791|nr:autophagy-related protein 27 [Gamsiella multidivaricata]KAI7823616.1 autophagy-related protein 27 [Gamsiella multidivaricata]